MHTKVDMDLWSGGNNKYFSLQLESKLPKYLDFEIFVSLQAYIVLYKTLAVHSM